MLLDRIETADDLKKLPIHELKKLCEEIRRYFISTILQTGGHFAGNLGVVELSVALHYVFESPGDKLIWDVGHQSYIHKILTGRKNLLHTIREFGGISGFPKMSESSADHFGTGHSSTSISAACGMAAAALIKQEKHRKFIAVVGDGALTGGMSFEALNNLGNSESNVLVIINDNQIGIDPNNGSINRHLQHIESQDSNIFSNLGLPYYGPVDGHDVEALCRHLQEFKNHSGPQVFHIRTVKGKGFPEAEVSQTRWHSTSKFVKITSEKSPSARKWQDAFSEIITSLAAGDPRIVGITPAMPSGSGMIAAMEKFPDRFFDVGIAEQHAVTFSAGLAAEGMVPFLNIYSTFLQRGYDQFIHDVALQNLPVVFCIDRAGLVGEDGPTHHGAFDISFLRCIPGIILSAPRDENELSQLMTLASKGTAPFCIRYPKGNLPGGTVHTELEIGKGICLKPGKKIALAGTGIASNFCMHAAESFKEIAVFHFPFIQPADPDLIKIMTAFETIITVEDGTITGGFGEGIANQLSQLKFAGTVKNLGIPNDFITHGDNELLYELCGYSVNGIIKTVQESLHQEAN